MKFKLLFLSILTITALLTGCATTQPEITNNNFNSTLWVQTAAEYEANSIQAYNSAESNIALGKYLNDPKIRLSPDIKKTNIIND